MSKIQSSSVLVVNGPNLNLLGQREPDIYGTDTLDDIGNRLRALAGELNVSIECRQSNHEGHLIDWIQDAASEFAGLIINPGGLTHSSVALADAIRGTGLPTVEVHVSNIFAREAFRGRSLIAPVSLGTISGLGADGYELALRALARHFGNI